MRSNGNRQRSRFALGNPLEGQVQNTATHENVVHLSVTPKQAIIEAARLAGLASR